MPLTYDQQKNIHRLIDNAGAGTYEEVRDELYDHLVQAVESRMEAKGVPFTEAQQEALEEMGGASGLKTIELGYVQVAEKQVWRMFKAFFPVYFKSMRWLIPLALGLTINQYTWVSVVAIFGYLVLIPPALGSWHSWNLGSKSSGFPVSLKMCTLKKRAALLVPTLGLVCSLLLGIQVQGIIPIALLITIYTLADYCLAFIQHTRKTLLEIA